MKFKIIISLSLLILIFQSSLKAQNEMSSYFIENTGAGLYLQPAFVPEATFSWYLPSIYYLNAGEGLDFRAILESKLFDLDSFDDLKGQDTKKLGTQISLFGFSYNHEFFQIHAGQNFRYFNQFDFNNQLFDIVLNGNAQYIGETINVGPNIQFNFFNEIYLGAGAHFGNFDIGGRIKRLNGLLNLETPRHDFSLYTNEEIYQLEFNTDYQILSNMLYDNADFGASVREGLVNIGKNGGWAFDFGFSAEIVDQFKISASLLDMGFIEWKGNPTKIETQGEFIFEGFEISELITDSIDIINLDSLGQLVNIDRSEEAYRTALPVQLYIGMQYYLSENWELNGLFYNAFSSGKSQPAVSIIGKYKPSEYFHTSFGYSWNQFSNFNISWSAEAHLKWFHVFLSMDNILDTFRPLGADYFNIRSGIQIDLKR